MTKITKLTPEQEARMPEFRDKWIKIGLSTEPADRPRAEAAITKMYAMAGLPTPKIVWCGSPLSMALTRSIVRKLDSDLCVSKGIEASVWNSVGASVRASVWNSVGASVGASVRNSVGASVRASVGASVGASVWNSVGDSVRASVRASVWASVWNSVGASVWSSVADNVWASVCASVRASVVDSVRDSVFGQHEAGWLAFYDFFSEVCGVPNVYEKLGGLWELARTAGWALPHQNICWVSERHCIVRQDEQHRIHALDGPAICYPDGFEIHAVRGVRVPREWIEDRKSLTPQIALTWANIEQRRVACELLGWNAILSTLDAKTIDKDGDPEIGELVEVILPDSGPERFLRVRCGTGREFALSVPRNMQTALQAQAWTWALDEKTFIKPEIRT